MVVNNHGKCENKEWTQNGKYSTIGFYWKRTEKDIFFTNLEREGRIKIRVVLWQRGHILPNMC